MEKRLFFLREDGWFEAELTRGLMLASHEELASWACIAVDRFGYRNYMVTENPHCVMAGRADIIILHTTGLSPADRHAS